MAKKWTPEMWNEASAKAFQNKFFMAALDTMLEEGIDPIHIGGIVSNVLKLRDATEALQKNAASLGVTEDAPEVKRGRGRPKGSKNAPKNDAPADGSIEARVANIERNVNRIILALETGK